MKILMICGVYAEENEQEVLSCTKGYAEQSANIFQRKLIRGIEKNKIDFKVISAPLIGAYPMRFTKSRFKGFAEECNRYEYVSFNNIWGIRNISRALSLKKSIKKYFANESEDEFLILVYCPHTPFLEAAIYAKELKPKSKVCLVVPDLPQYMNLNESGRGVYDFCKKIDIRHMEKFIAKVDSFVLLTEPMKDVLRVGERPYLVVEGIVDSLDFLMDEPEADVETHSERLRYIVYTGKMNVKFGIKDLVDNFMKLPGDEFRLVLCGKGDAEEYICEKSKLDYRIMYIGQVPHEEAKAWMYRAEVLVNPRKNEGEYTKYSFPSKTIEYLMTGAPVVSYLLDGMPHVYSDFLCTVNDNKLNDAMTVALSGFERHSFRKYAENNLLNDVIVKRIVDITFGI